jgi:hypothetical protein
MRNTTISDVRTRIVWLLIGLLLFSLAAQSAYDLRAAFAGVASRPELPGLQVMLAVALGAAGLGLVRQALIRVPRLRVGSHAVALFGYGWLVGLVLNDVITLIRRTPPTYESAYAVAIAVLSWLVVTPILSIPGLVALFVARRFRAPRWS